MNAPVIATDGMKGFDCNVPITDALAATFAAHGYDFGMRYLPRIAARANDLTAAEVELLLSAGLLVGAVQHVESASSWMPSGKLGASYGAVAAQYALDCGILPGCNVWCDLEGVALGTPAQTTIDYCNAWYDGVATPGLKPALYVGWRSGLNPTDLYGRLKFDCYWASYNLNSDQFPAVRGVCMKQLARYGADPEIACDFDIDIIHADRLGAFPTLLGRET